MNGEVPLSPAIIDMLNRGWIGRRGTIELIEWTRRWNLAHPGDRVQLTGVDAQDFTPVIDALGDFLVEAYGNGIAARWTAARTELLAADEQSSVFGNSDVSAATRALVVET